MEYTTYFEVKIVEETNKNSYQEMFDTANAAVEYLWERLTDKQRLSFSHKCCSGCGGLDTTCPCWNDE